MKTIFVTAAAASLTLMALQPVMAQDTSSQLSSADSSAASEAVGSMSSQPSSQPVDINYDQIISALQAGKMADLTTITESSTINFVLMSDLKANGDTSALDSALENNADAATLQSNVDTNAALSAKLAAAGYTNEQVVAVTASDDGSFTVVINDQHP